MDLFQEITDIDAIIKVATCPSCFWLGQGIILLEGEKLDFVFSVSKVSNGLDEYLPRHSVFKDCFELDVHHMTSQILSILIDFIQDRAFFVPFFRSFLKSLNLNNSGTRNDIKKR